jgi:DNA replication and repair protein RecF
MLDKIQLTDFRNHTSLELEFGNVTVITGPNGSGKTAVLEAVSLLSVASSWKTERDLEMIKWEQPFCRVVGADRDVVIQRSPAYKRYKMDGISKRLNDVLGTLPTVLFQPDDSALVHGAPAYRRRMLDRLLSQTVTGYARALSTLQKVLKQRNKLLKAIQEGNATTDQLPYWDNELAAQAEIICQARHDVLKTITPQVQEYYRELMPEGDKILLSYDCSPRDTSHSFLTHLEHNRHKEIQAGTSLYGPHREDLLFTYGEHPAAECFSRGQARALVLAIKLAEISYVQAVTDQAPILLLDDVFAEFDAQRRERILHLVGTYQSILTVTDLAGLENQLPREARHIVLG